MANVTAADVKRLRELTGSGMLDCKNALANNDGDFDKAAEELHQGCRQDVGKPRAPTAEGNGLVARDGAMIELNSETDFVAKNDEFQARRPGPRRRAGRRDQRRRRAPRLPRWATAPSPTPSRHSRPRSARSSSCAASSSSTARWRRTCTSVHRTCPRVGVLVSHTGDGEVARGARGAAMQVAALKPPLREPRRGPRGRRRRRAPYCRADRSRGGQARQALPKIVEGRLTGFFRTSSWSTRVGHRLQEDRRSDPVRRGCRGEGLHPFEVGPVPTGLPTARRANDKAPPPSDRSGAGFAVRTLMMGAARCREGRDDGSTGSVPPDAGRRGIT